MKTVPSSSGLRLPKARSGVLTPSHARAKKQEREAAHRMLVAGSGNGRVKGDCRMKGVVRLECKTTSKVSYALSRDLVQRIEAAAVAGGEVPAFEIEFCDKQGRKECSVLVVPSWVLEELIVREQNNNADVSTSIPSPSRR